MAKKWNLQDIRPKGTAQDEFRKKPLHRHAQDIRKKPILNDIQDSFDNSDLETIKIINGNSVKRKRFIITAAVSSAIILLGFFINTLLGGAEITIYPKDRDVSVQANFTAYLEPQVNELGYELLSLEATGERKVNAAGKEAVSERAQGKILVYNTKKTSSQRLIKNTRFESPDGLIFRIQESIEIPGVTTDEKGDTIPGSIVADVFAEETGDKYNIKPIRFTVPGLKGTNQYETIYAESAVAFTGGFEGEKYIIDENEFNTAKQSLDLELRDKLLARLKEEKPVGFIIYVKAITFVYEQLPAKEHSDSSATINERARLQVPMFSESEFSKFLAEQSIPDYKGSPVTILDPHTLSFMYTDPLVSQGDISKQDSIEFTLSGGAKIVWTFDEEKIKRELLGIKKSATADMFKTYDSISNVKTKIRPFWATEFPDNEKDIKIRTVIKGME